MNADVRTHPPAAAAGKEPRDEWMVRKLLRSVGLKEGEYDPLVVPQFVEVARRYAGDVLVEARAYAGHAGRVSLEADDVRLAIRAKAASSPGPPRREVMLDLARSRNTIQLPKSSAPPGSIPLPPLQDTMLSQNYLFAPLMKPPPDQVEETEEDDEVPNPNTSTEQEHSGRASEKLKQQQQPSQRTISSRLNLMAAAAAKRRRMNS
ncbi:hypothetical protein EJB05_11302 [Eragrostis curvula]|uniref:Transcription initiation factor TFIID subunit 9 n=1 Tax=Eragrostis curvula TaxID=38414 RepID=A0A5J9VR06_9POAL|nr:hypothetical protein EJB05_11302 [Eragrostis curvula]